jgi:hypothetical protein
MYKIVSRAINNRLNLIVNRICSRAQKGFNSHRYTQEVLINVIETIRFCNNNCINGAVVAVDMAKAFDTLSHRFLREVFKFFGLGPNITRWLLCWVKIDRRVYYWMTVPIVATLLLREDGHRVTIYHPVAAGPPWGSARELSPSPLTRRGDPPPPPGPGEGDVTTPYSWS